MKKLILTIMIGIFLISFVSPAVVHLGTFKQNTCLTLPQSCTTCTYNNISRIYVDGAEHSVVVLEELAMGKNGFMYNYTFCNTSILGEYVVEGHGDLDGIDTIWNYGFAITTTGGEPALKITILLLICSLIAFLLAILLKSKPIGFISGILFVISGMYIMIYGLGDVADLYTRAVALITIAFGALVSILAGLEWLEDIEEG